MGFINLRIFSHTFLKPASFWYHTSINFIKAPLPPGGNNAGWISDKQSSAGRKPAGASLVNINIMIMDRDIETKRDASPAGRKPGGTRLTPVEAILSYVNIVDEISEFVKLKKVGSNYAGLCPFHSEKTPSFNVNETKGLYYCFGCGKGGNVIGFLKDIKGESFSEVILYLKRKYNIPLEDTKYYKSDKSQTNEEPLKKILNLSLNFYYENLFVYLSSSRHIIKYLRERGIDEDAAKDFKLGFAGFGNELTKLLSNNGANLDIGVDAGLLVKKSGAGGSYFDRFANKLIIPIFDRNSEPVAFASRSVSQDQGGPKYINTNNSGIFIKSNTLYGLNKSLPFIKKENAVIVVEGYFDMMTLYLRGVKNVVATMGTALSKSHIINLSRLCDEVILLYDGDRAGINAINRGIGLFQGFMDNSDKNIYAVCLSGGDDPDSFVRKYGPDRLIQFVSDNKKSPVDFALDYYINIPPESGTDLANAGKRMPEAHSLPQARPPMRAENAGALKNNYKNDSYSIENNKNGGIIYYDKDEMGGLKKKISILKDIAPVLKSIDNNIILSHYINLVSNKLGLRESVVRSYVTSKKIPEFRDLSDIHSESAKENLNIEDLIIGKLFCNLPLTDYINDDTIKEFSDKDAIYIIREIKKAQDAFKVSEADAEGGSGFHGGNSRIVEEIISNTENKPKWSRIYYFATFSFDYFDYKDKKNETDSGGVHLEDDKRDVKRLLIKLKIDNMNRACGRLLNELKSGKLDKSAKLLKLKELNNLKYLSKELQKKICSF